MIWRRESIARFSTPSSTVASVRESGCLRRGIWRCSCRSRAIRCLSRYQRLVAEGYLNGRVGNGTFVGWNRWWVLRGDMPQSAPCSHGRCGNPYKFRAKPRRLLLRTTFARAFLTHACSRLRRGVGWLLGTPAGRCALWGLRRSVRRRPPSRGDHSVVGVSRSVRAGADDVVVTQGAQQAMDLIGRVLIEPRTVVAIEEPGYPPVRLLFRSLGARVVGVPVDAEGLDVAAIPSAARLIYVTPSHQFPLGTPMSLSHAPRC